MDDTDECATLDLTGEKSDESPSSGSDIVDFANRQSTWRATKSKDILVDSDDSEVFPVAKKRKNG